MKARRSIHSFALALFAIASFTRAAVGPTFAERLGWPASAVVVILHVDDVGMAHSSNLGAIEASERGVATSFAVMMPCPWVPEISRYLKDHPAIDSGLHLTLTAEWTLYRWGPLAGKSQVPGLVDEEGCLWKSVALVAQHATPDEVEREIRAQIDRAQVLGLPITHLDSHMGTLFSRPDYFDRFVKVAVEKKIPLLAVGGHATHTRRENLAALTGLQPWIKQIWNAGLPLLDDLHSSSGSWPPAEKTATLKALLASLNPGVTEIIFHASRPTEDFPLITHSSASRLADLDALTDPSVKQFIAERGIILTTWKELMARRGRAAAIE
ncbi:MAG: ChbG/HpnK family deacetylase [Opitutus sp.]|nr:ChbG/HpnK family deacetylase [Opitutus sp.]